MYKLIMIVVICENSYQNDCTFAYKHKSRERQLFTDAIFYYPDLYHHLH